MASVSCSGSMSDVIEAGRGRLAGVARGRAFAVWRDLEALLSKTARLFWNYALELSLAEKFLVGQATSSGNPVEHRLLQPWLSVRRGGLDVEKPL